MSISTDGGLDSQYSISKQVRHSFLNNKQIMAAGETYSGLGCAVP